MAQTKEQKEQQIKEVEASVTEATSVVFIAYDRLTVSEVEELRASLGEAGGSMRVVPKRLLKIAAANSKIDFDPTAHEGQVAVVWADDAVAPAKTLSAFAKEHDDAVRLLAGTLEGNVLSVEEVSALAKLPSKQELLGQLVSVFAGPTRGLVTVFSGVQRNTVNVLKAIADQKES